MTPQELREVTKSTIKELTKKANLEKERQRQAEAQRKEEGAKIKAKFIIEQIPARASTEAKAGRYHAIVMSVDKNECGSSTFPEGLCCCDPTLLTGTARFVYDHCDAEGFKPTLEYWSDGYGYNDGFNIVIHW